MATVTTPRTNLATNPSFETASGTVNVRTNLCTNPSFEATSGTVTVRTNLAGNPAAAITNGWGFIAPAGLTGAAMNVIASGGPSGGPGTFVRLSFTGGSGNASMGFYRSGYPITAGTTYTMSRWVRFSQAATVTASLEFYNASSVNVGTVGGTATAVPANTWTRVSVTATAPASAVTTNPTSYSNNITWTGTDTTDVTGELLEQSSVVGTYFDGSTAAAGDFTYSWSGAANASTSYQQAPGVATFYPSPNIATYSAVSLSLFPSKSMAFRRKNNVVGSGYVTMGGLGAAAANTSYTVSLWAYGGVGSYNLFLNDNNNAQTINPHSTTFSAPGNVWTRVSFTFTTTASFPNLTLFLSDDANTAPTEGSTLYVDGLLIEQSPVLGAYFDGANPISNLVTNPSFETDTSGWAIAGTATLTRDAGKYVSGAASMKVDPSSGVAYSGAGFSPVVTVGVTYTYSASIWAPAGTTVNFAADCLGVNTAVSGNGAWQRVSVTGTAVGQTPVYARSTAANQAAFWVDAVMVEASPTMNPFYSGTGDFTYAWSGAVNASTSVQQAPGVASCSGNNQTAVVQSTLWTNSRSKSLRVIATGTSADTYSAIGGDLGGVRLGMVAGGTYTASATIYGPGINPSSTIRAYYNTGSGYVTLNSSADAKGRHSVTFTLPSNATEAFIRLYNGAPAGNGDVWWDDFLLEQSATLGTYFDGATAAASPPGYSPAATWTYSWTGAADASTSIQTLSVPLQDYQITLPNGTITGAGTPVGYLEASGLRGSTPSRASDMDRAGVDGAVPGMSYLTSRTVGVKWLIAAPTIGAEAALQILTGNWQNTTDPSTVVMTARDYLLQQASGGSRPVSALKFQLPGRPVPILVLGKPGKLEAPVNSAYQFGWLEVPSEWVVPDGKIYDATVNTATASLPTSAGTGAAFPWSFPVNFGPSTGGTLQVVNGGKYPAKPVFKVTGPVANPRITNPATGQFIRVNLTLGAGDVLVIDTDSRVVRLNGVNRNNALDTGSAFFTIPPGGASLSFSSTDGGAVAGSVTAYTLNTYSAL